MYRHLFVPLDGEQASEHALPVALSIARRCGAALTLAHVVEDRPSPQERRALAANYLDDLVSVLAAPSTIKIETARLSGSITKSLRDYAIKARVDLVVMTSNPRGLLSSLWSGSVADQFARQSPAPVLIVPAPDTAADLSREVSFNHILINLDMQDTDDAIVGPTVRLGQLFDADVTLLSVTPSATALNVATADVGVFPSGAAPGLAEELQAEARARLEALATPLRADGPRVETEALIDGPGDEILEVAQERGVDLVAMTSRGRSEFARWTLGRVTDKALRQAQLALLIYRGPAE